MSRCRGAWLLIVGMGDHRVVGAVAATMLAAAALSTIWADPPSQSCGYGSSDGIQRFVMVVGGRITTLLLDGIGNPVGLVIRDDWESAPRVAHLRVDRWSFGEAELGRLEAELNAKAKALHEACDRWGCE